MPPRTAGVIGQSAETERAHGAGRIPKRWWAMQRRPLAAASAAMAAGAFFGISLCSSGPGWLATAAGLCALALCAAAGRVAAARALAGPEAAGAEAAASEAAGRVA